MIPLTQHSSELLRQARSALVKMSFMKDLSVDEKEAIKTLKDEIDEELGRRGQ